MNAKIFSAISIMLLCGAVIAQQQNTGYASMTINGAVGAPYPILTNVRTSTQVPFAFLGATNQPYVVYQTTGPLAVGTAFIPGGNSANSVDISLTPAPVIPINGNIYPVFSTDGTGSGGFVVMLPNAGSPPAGITLGTQLSLQAVLADPFSTIGHTLTAATRVTVTQGPTVTNLNLGDDGLYTLNTSANPIPFYGANYSSMTIYSNGYIMMGASPPSDFSPTPSLFISSSPRIAGFWMDLVQQSGTIVLTVDTPQGTPPNQTPGFVSVVFTNVEEYFVSVTHSFAMMIRTDGYLEIIQPPSQNAGAGFDEITGIGPGNNVGGAQPQQNFVGNDPDGAGSQTTGILTTPPAFSKAGMTNESFYEWFGNFTMPSYGNSYINNFDLFARTLHFLPNGSAATLPQTTSGYTLY